MLSFEEFSEKMIKTVGMIMRRGRDNVEVVVIHVPEGNEILTGITTIAKDQKITTSPTVYLEKLYRTYQTIGDYDELVKNLEPWLVEAIKEQEELLKLAKDPETAKKNIVFSFLHTKQNEDILGMMPKRLFHDLSITYTWLLKMNQDGINKIPVTNEVMDFLGVNEQELYELAYENTKRILEPVVMKIDDVTNYLLHRTTQYIDLFDAPQSQEENSGTVYAVTNRGMSFGATSVLYKEELQKLAEKLNSNLFLVPISNQLMWAMSDEDSNSEELAELLYFGNQVRSIGTRLSNEIYLYDKETQEITQVTDSEHKMLVEKDDGMSVSM